MGLEGAGGWVVYSRGRRDMSVRDRTYSTICSLIFCVSATERQTRRGKEVEKVERSVHLQLSARRM